MRRMGMHFAERPIARCLLAVVVFLVLSGCNLGTALPPSPTPATEAAKPVTRTPAVESARTSPTPAPTATPRFETPTATPTTEPAVTPPPVATATMDATFTVTSTATLAPAPSPSPSSTTEITCTVLPEGPFLGIWLDDSPRQVALGCPTSNPPRITPVAWEVETSYQPFENGAMVWSDKIGWYEQPVIYVSYTTGEFDWYHDAYEPGDAGPVVTPPAGFLVPALGFGRLWDEHPDVRTALGWATAPETPGPGRFQLFMGGAMIWLSQRGETYVFVNGLTPTYAIETTPAFAD